MIHMQLKCRTDGCTREEMAVDGGGGLHAEATPHFD